MASPSPDPQGGVSPTWAEVARRVRVPLGFLFAVLYLWLARPTRNSIVIGVLVIIPGLVIRALASGHVQKNEELTTTGPYAYTRNPLYLGSCILALGFAVAARSWLILFVMLIIFLAVYVPVIYSEEAFLRQKFPGFEEYASRVPRLMPHLYTVRGREGRFSGSLYSKHREYNAILGAAAMMLALLVKLLWGSK